LRGVQKKLLIGMDFCALEDSGDILKDKYGPKRIT